jgi:hypothetical protein
MRFPGKQIAPTTAMGNLPAIAAPQSLEQYLARINEGLATAEYLVGPTAPFTTIQSAINQAVADGASPSNPKVVLVMPSAPYVGNITLTTGGIALVALAPNTYTGMVWIAGNVSIVDPGLGASDYPSYWIEGFYIEGNVTISGAPSTNICYLTMANTYVYAAAGNAITNGVNGFGVELVNKSLVTAVTPANFALFSAVGSRMTFFALYSSMGRVSVANGSVVGLYSQMETVVCGSAAIARLDYCGIFSTSEAPVQLGNTAGNSSFINDCLFNRTGTAGPAVTSVGATAPYIHARNTVRGSITDPAFPSVGSIDGYDWEGYADTTRNRTMVASVTVADGNLACATALSVRPAQGSMISVLVNGVKVLLAATAAAKATSDCYFSANGGVTAKSFGQLGTIAAGDLLYWNGSVALYQLAATDRIDFEYAVSPYQVN